MSKIQYIAAGGFTTEQMDSILKESFKVLNKIGILLDHDEIVKEIKKFKGIKVENNRIYYEYDLIEKYLNSAKKNNLKITSEKKEEKFSLSASYLCLNILDHNTNEIRQSKASDLVTVCKVCDVLGVNPRNFAPVEPTDTALNTRALFTYKTTCECSQTMHRSTRISTYEEAKYLKEMAAVMGDNVPIGIQFIVSPLKFDYIGLDLIYKGIKDKTYLVNASCSPIPIAGVTAPMFVPGGFVQTIAETLGAYIFISLLSEGRFGNTDFLRLDPFDMQYCNISFGGPEWSLYHLMGRQLTKYLFGYEQLPGSFRTLAKLPDSQASAERISSVFTGALDGAVSFAGAGQMSIDEIFSLEQMVLDIEILRYVEHIVKGFEYAKEDGLSFNTIKQIVDNKEEYLTHETTQQYFQDMYWNPKVFKHWNLGQWTAAGSPTSTKMAKEIINEALKKHQYVPDAKKIKELERIYELASK